jgi:hypothetical protein
VQRYDGDQLTVLFDDCGYRDLLVPLVVERQLLRPRRLSRAAGESGGGVPAGGSTSSGETRPGFAAGR